jgi:hypothetical protein
MAMPEPLWTLAANVARQHGLARVARFARLDYYSLKEHVARLDGDSGAEAKPTFIEFQPVPASLVSECTIELENSKDYRMRIQIKGAPMPDIAALRSYPLGHEVMIQVSSHTRILVAVEPVDFS